METKTDSVKLQELISQLKSYFESRDSRIRLEHGAYEPEDENLQRHDQSVAGLERLRLVAVEKLMDSYDTDLG